MTRNKTSDQLKQITGGTNRGGLPVPKFQRISKADYNALAVKDPNVLYLVTA